MGSLKTTKNCERKCIDNEIDSVNQRKPERGCGKKTVHLTTKQGERYGPYEILDNTYRYREQVGIFRYCNSPIGTETE